MIDLKNQSSSFMSHISKTKKIKKLSNPFDRYYTSKIQRSTAAEVMAFSFLFGTVDIIRSSNLSYTMMSRLLHF